MATESLSPLTHDIITSAVHSAMDGFSIIDCQQPGFPIIYVNKAFEEITGYQAREVLGHNCNILHGSGSDKNAITFIDDTINSGKEARVIIKNYRKDGAAFWNELYLVPIVNDNKQLSNYLCVQKDLSHTHTLFRPYSMEQQYDLLTGVPNRAGLLEHINVLGTQQQFALFFIRVSGVKAVENVHGSLVANTLLNDVGKLLVKESDDKCSLFRIGDYDFCILRRGLHKEQEAIGLSEDILQYFKAPFGVEKGQVKLSVNIGVVAYRREEACPEELLQKAELALTNAAVSNSNNSVSLYNHAVLEQTERTMRLLADLPNAIEQDQLYVVYQSQVDCQTGAVSGCEALVRWAHHDLGQISPGEFIPLAERNDLIMEITCYVLEQVCKDLRKMEQIGVVDTVAVNVSALLLHRDDLPSTLFDIVEKNNADPQRIEIEIVENVVVEQRAIKNLFALRDCNFTIAIDDFGTGFSSLSYLRQIPADKIKIDKSFIDEIDQNDKGELIAKSLIELCKGLDFNVVAEGVEYASQRNFLAQSGCDIIQGYFYCVPKNIQDYLPFRSQWQ